MASSYNDVKQLHVALPPFAPAVPTALLPYLAFTLLASTFALAFYFTTLPAPTIPSPKEAGVAGLASVLAGFGVVALFCTAGVYL